MRERKSTFAGHRDRKLSWRETAVNGFFAEALASGDAPAVYKAAIKFAALVRRSMTTDECRRASVELILEADDDERTD